VALRTRSRRSNFSEPGSGDKRQRKQGKCAAVKIPAARLPSEGQALCPSNVCFAAKRAGALLLVRSVHGSENFVWVGPLAKNSNPSPDYRPQIIPDYQAGIAVCSFRICIYAFNQTVFFYTLLHRRSYSFETAGKMFRFCFLPDDFTEENHE
jgi:hypothetical protein